MSKALNKEQLEAVNFVSGNLLIMASAGTGKTTTIVERYVNMVKNHGYKPSEIMMTTFTNKAAKDMVKKIVERTGREPPNVGTMHSLFLKIIRNYTKELGLSPNFTFLDDEADKRKIVKDILAKEGIDARTDTVRYFVRWIGKFKNRGILAENLSEMRTLDEGFTNAGELVEEELDDDTIRIDPALKRYVNKIYKRYQEELKKQNLIDFDDIMLLTFKLFDQHPDIRESYAKRFKAIMVDEAQDLNVVQKNILNLLKNNNLCLIGDDCQNIYEWRGSSNQLVFDFSESEKTIFLQENYRSEKKIIDSVNKVIKEMRFKIDKKLVGTKEGKGNVAIQSFATLEEEQEFIVYEVKKLLEQKVKAEDIAVLFRTNRIGKEMERELKKNKIPCHLSKAKDFFEREEMKDILAFLKLKVNPHAAIEFQRVFCLLEGLSKGTAKKFQHIAIEKHCSLVDALGFASELRLSEERTSEIMRFKALLDDFEKNPLFLFLNEFGYGKYLRQKYEHEIDKLEDKVANIEVVKELYKEYGNSKEDVQAFLDSIIELDKKDKTSGKVILSTIHSAKGLEWEHVFLVSCNEGTLPYYQHELDELKRDSELRLFYVAISRAKKGLVISHYAIPAFGFGREQDRSSFLDIIE